MHSSSQPVQGSRSRSAWVVLLAGIAAASHVGKMAPALPALRDALGISLTEAGFLLSAVQIAGLSLGLALGAFADGFGLRRSVLLGLILIGSVSVLGSQAQSPVELLVCRALEGIGLLLVALPAPALIRRLTPEKQVSSMLGYWGSYMPAGTVIAMLLGPYVLQWSAQGDAWRVWWFGLGALSLAVALLGWLQIPPDPGRSAPTDHLPERWLDRVQQTLSHREPWLAALCFAMYSGQWLAVVGFLPSLYGRAGYSVTAVSVLSALVVAANALGNMASGKLLQAGCAPRKVLTSGYVVMALGAVLGFSEAGVLRDAGPAVRYLGVLAFSAVGGLIPGSLFALAVRAAPTPQTLSTTVGWMQQLSALGQFCGPPVVAWVAQQTGSWSYSCWVTGACSCVGLVLAWGLARSIESR